jgi:hypothetical protein
MSQMVSWKTVVPTYCIAFVLLIWCKPALSQRLPKEMLGEWYRIDGESVGELAIAVQNGRIVIANHLDGEGYECHSSSRDIRTRNNTNKKLILVTANAMCQAEENSPERQRIVLSYSRTTRGSETLTLDNGSKEVLRRRQAAQKK